jgi:hypothetical protein
MDISSPLCWGCIIQKFGLDYPGIQHIKTATSLTLANPISILWGSPMPPFVATLKDTDSGVTLSGRTIHFDGTGVIGVSDVPTDATGIALSTGTAPNTVATGWTVQSHYAGDSLYKNVNSAVKTYSTMMHVTSLTLILNPTTVIHGSTYSVSGVFKDSTLSLVLAGKTIDFTTDNGAVTIPSTTATFTGAYSVTGLVAPNVPTGTLVHITAKYAGESLYKTISVTKVLKIN